MIYLLYGEDDYLKNRQVNKIKKDFGEVQEGINYIKLDENNISEIISDIETPAFGFEKKLIICRDTGLFKKKSNNKDTKDKEEDEEDSSSSQFSKLVNEYLEENNIDDVVDLVFVESNINKNKLFKTISKKGNVIEFPLKKDFQVAKDMMQVASLYKVKLDSINANYLVSSCGTNMQDLMNEIRKLIEYVGAGGTIQKEDIDALAIKKPEAVIFDLTDYLGNKELKKALDTYRDLISQNVSDQMILIMIYRHFRNLYIFKLSNVADVATNLKLKPNQTFLPKIYARQAQYFTVEELKEILFELINIDESTKNGNLDSISLGLESIMCKYFGK